MGEVNILKSSTFAALDEAAIVAAKKCIFLPGIKNCRPDTVAVTLNYMFPDRLSSEFPCTEEVDKPSIKCFMTPQYPEDARLAGMEGKVLVKVLVDRDGSAKMVEVLQSSGHPILDELACDAARKSKFHPGRQRCIPVRGWMGLPYTFRLK